MSADLWRYEAEIVQGEKPYIHFRHEADGGWVHFTDYDRLSQQLAATIAEWDRVVSILRRVRDNTSWRTDDHALWPDINAAIAAGGEGETK